MLFSSLTFICVFLPIVCIVYSIVSRNAQNFILLLASIIFYAWGEPKFLLVMLCNILVCYIFAIRCDVAVSEFQKKISILAAIVINLMILGYFKYLNFFIENINALFSSNLSFIKIVLPIGISFYTFQGISYLIDVYRGECSAQKNIYKLALYISLFPQLVAGPIVKYRDIYEQIDNRVHSIDNVYYGLCRFVMGLAKKVIIANSMGEVADAVFAQNADSLTFGQSWLGIITYSLQIYFDFSGYSDMAIGLCAIFGFKIQENFNYPYTSRTVSEYWRRWHISMGTWFRDYLFYPISRFLYSSKISSVFSKRFGKKKASNLLTVMSLAVVWFATGLWHGAGWNFIAWGMINGIFIMFELLTGLNREKNRPIYLNFFFHIYTLMVEIVCFVFFRSPDFAYALQYLRNMLGANFNLENSIYSTNYSQFDVFHIGMFVIAIILCCPFFRGLITCKKNIIQNILFNVWIYILFFISLSFIVGATYNPFIYFKF